MNYLAHAYLSFRLPEIVVGNMISDFIKGKKQFDYPAVIQEGIRLHRAIDQFTDDHPATKNAQVFFTPAVGRYAGAFVDVVYDHFLALDSNEMDEPGWAAFSVEVYAQLEHYRPLLPEKFARLFPYMRSQDWLYHYRFTSGIENSFHGLVRRARYLDNAAPAFSAFLEHYDALREAYAAFFPDVKKFALAQLAARPIE